MQTVTERLQFIQDNHPNLVQAAAMLKVEIEASPGLKELIKINYNSADTFSHHLGQGFPAKYIKDLTEPVGFSLSNLDVESKRLYTMKESYGLDSVKVNNLFLDVLECIHHTEADALMFAKDKALGEMFPFLDQLYKGD